MAVTRTRTRTQDCLNQLSTHAANLHDELAYLQHLLTKPELQVHRALICTRQVKVHSMLASVYSTIRQFDTSIQPEAVIGRADDWRKAIKPRGKRVGLLFDQAYLAHWLATNK